MNMKAMIVAAALGLVSSTALHAAVKRRAWART